jgi:chromosome segregation ATPase
MLRSLLVILFGLFISCGAHAKMFKWVDKSGKTHYGDTIPPEYADQGNEQLDKRGQVVNKTDAALTPAQIKARDEAAAKAKKEKEDALEAQRRDKALLATYTELREIDSSLNRNLGAIDVQIKSNELRIKSAQGRLDGLKKQEATFVQRKKPVPGDIANAIKATEGEITQTHANIAKLEQEKTAMRQRYAADKARFRELKGMPPEPAAGTPIPASATPKK